MNSFDKENIFAGSDLYPVRISLDNIPTDEPYSAISEGCFNNDSVRWSPDPLISYRFNDSKSEDDLRVFKAYPVKYHCNCIESFENIDSVLSSEPDITVRGNGNIVFDFGVEFAAWLEITSPDLNRAETLKLGISEYNQPESVNKGPDHPVKCDYPKKISDDIYRLELNCELYEGVRFGFINVENFEKDFHITSVRLICQIKPSNYKGSFLCDNDMLNKIWYIAAYTVRLNLKKDYLSAILIDRGDRYSWTGDAYISQAASLYVFNNSDFVLNNLHFTVSHPNNIPGYELFWVMSLIDYWFYTGDKNGVLELIPYALNKLDYAYSFWNTDFDLSFVGWDERQGAGFEHANIEENRLSYRFLAIECWKRFADMLDYLDQGLLASKYRSYAEEKTKKICSCPEWYEALGLHSFSDAVNAGITDRETQQKMLNKLFSDRVNRISYCPFNEYFVLKALAKINRYDEAISSILDLWGGQIEYGCTCFFEVFRPEWNEFTEKNGPVPNNQAGYTSLAHPWSCGVLTWMTSELLGIKPVKPGFSEFSVTPHFGSFINNLTGKVPTPFGDIDASFDVINGRHFIKVPEGTIASVGLPKYGSKVSNLTVNGSVLKPDREDEGYLYFDGLKAGKYNFRINCSLSRREYQVPERKYASSFIGYNVNGKKTDKYGKNGYLFFSKKGQISNLPGYIENIKFSGGIIVPSKKCDNLSYENTAFKAVSEYATNFDNTCCQTFIADITLTSRIKYKVTLYFRDAENGKKLAVEMFDGKTYNMISPVKAVQDYTDGVFLTYEYDDSVRFRIDHVRGNYVSLSGILFDDETFPG